MQLLAAHQILGEDASMNLSRKNCVTSDIWSCLSFTELRAAIWFRRVERWNRLHPMDKKPGALGVHATAGSKTALSSRRRDRLQRIRRPSALFMPTVSAIPCFAVTDGFRSVATSGNIAHYGFSESRTLLTYADRRAGGRGR